MEIGHFMEFSSRTKWIILLTIVILTIPQFLSIDGGPNPFPPSVSPPVGLKALPGADRIILSWEEPDIGYITATGFSIYRSLDGIDFSLLVKVDQDLFHFHDEDIVIGRTFHYFIRTDSDLGQSESSGIVFSQADDEPPEIEIFKPRTDEIIGVADIVLTFDLEESGSGISTLHYLLDDDLPVDISGPPTIELDGLSEGYHSIEIVAEDIAGNMASEKRNFSIDTVPPLVDILSPGNGDMFSEGNFQVQWTMEDSGSGIWTTLISVNGGSWFEPSGSNSHLLSNMDQGPHMISLKVRDMAGNSAEDLVNILVDITGPTLKVTSPAPGSLYTKGYVRVDWMGEDEISDIQFNARANGGPWIRKGDSTYHIFSDLNEGKNLFEVQAVDGVGNSILDSVNVIIDETPPEIKVLDESDPIGSYGGVVDIGVELSDELTEIDDMYYRVDDGDWIRNSRHYRIMIYDLSNGYHTLIVRAADRAGNSREEIFDIVVDSIPPSLIDIDPEGTIHNIPDRIELSFSEEMDPVHLNVESPLMEVSIYGSGTEFWFYPGMNLEYGRKYGFTISGKDLNGIWMDPVDTRFEISDMVTITGRVVDTNGKAIEGAKVSLDDGMVTTTRNDGIFEFNVRYDTYGLFITHAGYERGESSIDARPGDPNWVGTIRLGREETSMGKKVLFLVSDPVNIIITGLLILLIVISSMALWRYFDRDIITHVDIEMDDDQN